MILAYDNAGFEVQKGFTCVLLLDTKITLIDISMSLDEGLASPNA
jgi:hypothetical protein